MPKVTNLDKIQCPHCACGQSEVETTRVSEINWRGKKRRIVRRYRKCRNCKLSFRTVETLDAEEGQPTNQEKADIATAAFREGYAAAMAELNGKATKRRLK